jgi:hypothetical protein
VPGRITDELRRITREQGGIAPPPRDASRPHRRTSYRPLIALAIVVLLTAVGWLIVARLMATSRLEDCVMSGRKNCVPIESNETGP